MTHAQTSYPARLLFIERATDRRYSADAIPAGDLPDLERDLGACCRLDGGPRYMVDGVERPDFDPTIPPDLYAYGWQWHGGWLRHIADNAAPGASGIVIGMPRESLDEVWTAARKVMAARDDVQASIAVAKAKQKPAKKHRQKIASPTPAAPLAYAQAAMEL